MQILSWSLGTRPLPVQNHNLPYHWPAAGETPEIQRIEDRIARFTMTHVQQGEGIQVLRYDVSGQRKASP